MRERRVGAGREAESRAAEARLGALFRTGWVPPDPGGQPASLVGGGVGADGDLRVEVDDPQTDDLLIGESDDRRPAKVKGLVWRLDPGRRGAAAVLAAALVAAALVGWKVVADRPRSRAVPVSAQLAVTALSGTPAASRPATSASAAARVVVDVVGKVVRPGVVRLPPGSRVDDAVRAAGGAIPGTDLSSLNLARLVVDGEQIAVGVAGAGGVGPGGIGSGRTTSGGGDGASGSGAPSGVALVNLNTATVAQLDDSLPGVGPVLAKRIVDWRTAHGRFESVEQLNQVTGVGAAKFADLKSRVTV